MNSPTSSPNYRKKEQKLGKEIDVKRINRKDLGELPTKLKDTTAALSKLASAHMDQKAHSTNT